MKSISFPQSNRQAVNKIENKSELWSTTSENYITEQTLQAIENITTTKKLQEKDNNENQENENQLQQQITNVEVRFKILQVIILKEKMFHWIYCNF